MIGGLLEGLLHVDSGLGIVTSTGFAMGLAAPVTIVLTLVLRLLWIAWKPSQLAQSLTDSDGAAPRLASWVLYLLLSLVALSVVSTKAVQILWQFSRSSQVIAVGTSLIVLVVSLLLAAGSWPAVRLLTELLRAVGHRLMPGALRPKMIVVATVLVIGIGLTLYWSLSIRPKVGYLQFSALFIGSLSILTLGFTLTWSRMHPTLQRGVSIVTIVALLCVAGTSVYTRYRRPFVLFDVWAKAPVGGFAIGSAYNLEQLRRDIDFRELKPLPLPNATHPDIILITIDTLRASRMSLYGGPARTPNIDQLAKRGAVFDRAYSPSNVTRRSLPTMITGVSPHRVIGRIAGWAIRLDPRHVTATERLRAGGYETAGFFCCESHFGPRHEMSLDRGIEHMEFDHDGRKLTTALLTWLQTRDATNSDKPLFTWMHTLDPHDWARLGRERKVKGTVKDKYDAVLQDLDSHLEPLLSYLLARKRETLIVITSDHGEGLGDHGSQSHARTLYNSEIHVPLIVSGNRTRTIRIDQPIGLAALAPTLLELAGFVPPGMPMMDGISVVPLLDGRTSSRIEQGDAYAVMVKDRSVEHESAALIVGRYKLLRTTNGEMQLFNIIEDPNELEDLADKEKDLLARLQGQLAARQEIDRISPF